MGYDVKMRDMLWCQADVADAKKMKGSCSTIGKSCHFSDPLKEDVAVHSFEGYESVDLFVMYRSFSLRFFYVVIWMPVFFWLYVLIDWNDQATLAPNNSHSTNRTQILEVSYRLFSFIES